MGGIGSVEGEGHGHRTDGIEQRLRPGLEAEHPQDVLEAGRSRRLPQQRSRGVDVEGRSRRRGIEEVDRPPLRTVGQCLPERGGVVEPGEQRDRSRGGRVRRADRLDRGRPCRRPRRVVEERGRSVGVDERRDLDHRRRQVARGGSRVRRESLGGEVHGRGRVVRTGRIGPRPERRRVVRERRALDRREGERLVAVHRLERAGRGRIVAQPAARDRHAESICRQRVERDRGIELGKGATRIAAIQRGVADRGPHHRDVDRDEDQRADEDANGRSRDGQPPGPAESRARRRAARRARAGRRDGAPAGRSPAGGTGCRPRSGRARRRGSRARPPRGSGHPHRVRR